jgi:excisionase family DNA binding protein
VRDQRDLNPVLVQDRHAPRLPEFLSVEEAATLAGVSKGVIYEMTHTGALPCAKFGRLVRIPRQALERLLDGSK